MLQRFSTSSKKKHDNWLLIVCNHLWLLAIYFFFQMTGHEFLIVIVLKKKSTDFFGPFASLNKIHLFGLLALLVFKFFVFFLFVTQEINAFDDQKTVLLLRPQTSRSSVLNTFWKWSMNKFVLYQSPKATFSFQYKGGRKTQRRWFSCNFQVFMQFPKFFWPRSLADPLDLLVI